MQDVDGCLVVFFEKKKRTSGTVFPSSYLSCTHTHIISHRLMMITSAGLKVDGLSGSCWMDARLNLHIFGNVTTQTNGSDWFLFLKGDGYPFSWIQLSFLRHRQGLAPDAHKSSVSWTKNVDVSPINIVVVHGSWLISSTLGFFTIIDRPGQNHWTLCLFFLHTINDPLCYSLTYQSSTNLTAILSFQERGSDHARILTMSHSQSTIKDHQRVR